MAEVLLWTLFGFTMGSIPFSLIMGKVIAKKDIRTVGDGNPGGKNALTAGGLKAGIPAIILDIGKGFLPVFYAKSYGITDWGLVPVCIAPILGHAFSPFLKFHGGKALGATGGVWMALIGPLVLFVYAILAVPVTLLQAEDAWSANAGMLCLLGYAILFSEPWLVAFAVLNVVVVAWKHHRELLRPSHFRPWVTNLFSGNGA